MLLLVDCFSLKNNETFIFKTSKTKVMKAFFYTLMLLVGIASCRSVEKMVERGEYDRAFNYAISKLQGEKNKKTEHVKGLEKAYAKLSSTSLREIEKLNANAKPENWSRVLTIYKAMENRQERLDPLLPLVSENGYVASFDLKSLREEIAIAEDNTCLYYYNNAKDLLDRSEKTKDKIYARNAYEELKKIDTYRARYRDIDALKTRALNLGLTTIYFEVYNDLRDFHGHSIERDILNLPVSTLDNLWYDFSIGEKNGLNPDFVVLVELLNINFSPERERVNTYSESKEILVSKAEGKEKRDTLDVIVKKEVYEKVRADIIEVFREKKSELNGRVRILDTRTNEYLKTIPINIFHDFNGYGCRYTGDERALTPESKKRMDNYLEFFPSDLAMTEDLSSAFKNAVMVEVRKVRF